MAGFRAYYEECAKVECGATVRLSQEESRHLCGSLRAVAGDIVDIFDLDGNVFACEITKADQKRAELVAAKKTDIAAPFANIYIAQCLPKGKVFDDIIRQSVEIGAAGIFPLISERSQVRLNEKDAEKKSEKWVAHVVEAVKQSANFFAFKMRAPQSFENFAAGTQSFDLKIVASLQDNSKPLLEVLNEHGGGAKDICILIGPEGDLSPKEYAAAEAAGFLPCTLGRNVMKCDTAAAASLAVCSAFYETKAANA